MPANKITEASSHPQSASRPQPVPRLMPIRSHLKDLRRGLIRCLIALLASSIVAFSFSDRILLWLKQPLPLAGGVAPNLVFLSPAEVLLADIKIALFFGLAAALPIILVEIWRFISPGLIEKEQRSFYPFLLFSSFSFYMGIAFSYYLALPFALQFLLSYGHLKGIVPQISIAMYIDFNLTFLLAFGLIFEIPIVMVLLSKTGLLTIPFLVHYRKYAVILSFVVAAILTPTPDIFNQALMAIPLMILYEIGILAIRLFGQSMPLSQREEERGLIKPQP